MATQSASGGQDGPSHDKGERVEFGPILFRMLSLIGIAALLWTFAAALGPVGPASPAASSGTAPHAPSLLNRLH